MQDRVLGLFLLIGLFSFLPILGFLFANLEWQLAFLPFALVVGFYPASLFMVIETIGEWHPVSILLKLVLLLHLLNFYYQQTDWLLDFDGSFLDIAGKVLLFVFMSPMITCFEYGLAIAAFVTISP